MSDMDLAARRSHYRRDLWPVMRRAAGPEVAPKNTLSEIIDKLNSEINAGLAEPSAQIECESGWAQLVLLAL
jgi:hypothetical protein